MEQAKPLLLGQHHMDVEDGMPSRQKKAPAPLHLRTSVCVRVMQLLALLCGSSVLCGVLDSFASESGGGGIVPRSWAFSQGISMAFAAFSLAWVIAFCVLGAASSGITNNTHTKIVLASLAYDVCGSILLFGAAIAVVPDSTGSSRSFEAEQRYFAREVHHSSQLIQDSETWNMQDAYSRVHRTVCAVFMFISSFTSIFSLALVACTQLEQKVV